MIEFRTLSVSRPDLAHSPLLNAALLTLQYAQEHGAIGLTKTMAFKRVSPTIRLGLPKSGGLRSLQ